MPAFVTGATGLLGSNLVHMLLQDGHEVQVLARNTAKASSAGYPSRHELMRAVEQISSLPV